MFIQVMRLSKKKKKKKKKPYFQWWKIKEVISSLFIYSCYYGYCGKKINIHVNEFLIYCINTSRQKRLTNFIKILQILQALQNQQLNKNTPILNTPLSNTSGNKKYVNFIIKNKESLSLNETRSITLTCLSGKLN